MGNNKEWGAIERKWCDGISARVLAKEYGISHTAINKRAKAEGWEKVSSEKHSKPSSGKGLSKFSTPGESEKPPETKHKSRRGNPHPTPRFEQHNTAALKHGGYSRRLLTSDANLEDAKAITLNDELERVRAANLEAAEYIGRCKTQMTDADENMQQTLMANIEAAYKSMDRNTARIQSLEFDITSMAKMRAEIAHKEAITEKVEMEIDIMKDGDSDNAIVVHNTLPIPGR